MAWQTYTGRRGRRQFGGANAKQSEVQQFAQELRAALMPQPRKLHNEQRKPEWRCAHCSTMNFMDRTYCRSPTCGELWTAGSGGMPSKVASKVATAPRPPVAAGPRLPPGSVWAESQPGGSPHAPGDHKPAARVAALERAAAATREAGASAEAREAIDRELAAAKVEVASTRPLGARLDSARAKVRKANAKLEAADVALTKAQTQRAEASDQAARAAEELKALEDECAEHSMPQPGLVDGVRKLLAALEGRAGGLPEEVVDSMAQLHLLTGTSEQAEAMEDEMRDHGAGEQLNACLLPAGASTADLRELGAEELQKRLEECHTQHFAALKAKEWSAAAALGSTLNRLTDALQGLADSSRA